MAKAEGPGPMIGKTGRSANYFGSKDGTKGKTVEQLKRMGYTDAQIADIREKVEATGRKLPSEPAGVTLASEYAILINDGNGFVVKDVVTALPTIVAGEDFNIQLAADGGYEPVLFDQERSKLPAGLSLTRDGGLRGTIVEPGSHTLTIFTIDGMGREAENTLTVSVTEPKREEELPEEVVAAPKEPPDRFAQFRKLPKEETVVSDNPTPPAPAPPTPAPAPPAPAPTPAPKPPPVTTPTTPKS